MKLAIVGKGGVGKTTLAASLARRLERKGRPVVAVDADPDGNLASALGVPPERAPEPIVHMRELVLERTGARDEGWGLMFKLNPKVDDLPERFSVDAGRAASGSSTEATRRGRAVSGSSTEAARRGRAASGSSAEAARRGGVRLLVLGTVETGGKGCMCPEGAVLKALLQHLLLRVEDDVILDMEAGLEHMGRASAAGVDAMIAVVEPGMRSVRTAERVGKLASDIGVKNVYVVMNRISDDGQREVLEKALEGRKVLGVLPVSKALAHADLEGRSADVDDPAFVGAVDRVGQALDKEFHHGDTETRRTAGR